MEIEELETEEDREELDNEDLLRRGREIFERADDVESENRQHAVHDLRFSRLGEQWPEEIRQQRETDDRPCLTINKFPAFIRQVVNDARQNKPSIKIQPVDGEADIETARIMGGLVRNIERSSKADVAYDTAIESAVSCGFGYFRINLDYDADDSFDLDIKIERISNAFSVYGDPDSTSADGSDWNNAFVVERLSEDQFKTKYGDKAKVDWDTSGFEEDSAVSWRNNDGVLVAEWWSREAYQETIHKLSDGTVVTDQQVNEDEDIFGLIDQKALLQIVASRDVTRHKVIQRIMTGFEILETVEWAGKYIPIVPVYGDEFDIQGERYLRSLIHNAVDAAKDAQLLAHHGNRVGRACSKNPVDR